MQANEEKMKQLFLPLLPKGKVNNFGFPFPKRLAKKQFKKRRKK